MEFTKIVKEFDCTRFEVGKVYYIKEHLLLSSTEQGVYLCTFVNDCNNEVALRKIVFLQGVYDGVQINISNDNFALIDEIQEVQFEVEWDTNFHEWRIFANIEPEVNNSES